jgi:hypothetical protein
LLRARPVNSRAKMLETTLYGNSGYYCEFLFKPPPTQAPACGSVPSHPPPYSRRDTVLCDTEFSVLPLADNG